MLIGALLGAFSAGWLLAAEHAPALLDALGVP